MDTGPIVAVLDESDSLHPLAIELFDDLRRCVVWTTWPVLTEAAYLLRGHLELVDRLIGIFHVEPRFDLLALRSDDLLLVQQLFRRYQNPKLQLADVSLVIAAHRSGCRSIATFDQRDFGYLRPISGGDFELLPKGYHAGG